MKGNRFMNAKEREAWFALAAQAISTELKKMNKAEQDLAQSMVDDVEFWGASASYTGGQ